VSPRRARRKGGTLKDGERRQLARASRHAGASTSPPPRDTAFVLCDGGSRGNPGPAAFAYTIERPGQSIIEEKGFLGETTNNIAEYTGIIRALEHAQKLGGRRLILQSDSELIIKQLSGAYKVKHPGLLPLYREADTLRRSFEQVTLRHVRRELNKRADLLCNQALDEAEGKARAPARLGVNTPAPSADPNRRDLERLVRDEALACLRASADAWAHAEGAKLRPEHVWEQLWSILIESGVLKKSK
jgi:ribonuclease HI